MNQSDTESREALCQLARGWRKEARNQGYDGIEYADVLEGCARELEDVLERIPSAHPGIVPEDEQILKRMVEAILYGEAALSAAQTKMTQNGDLKGAGLMQPALDKLRSAKVKP